jgi:hypothetical protein
LGLQPAIFNAAANSEILRTSFNPSKTSGNPNIKIETMALQQNCYKYPWQVQELSNSYRNAEDIVAMDFVNLKNKKFDHVVCVSNSVQYGIFVIVRNSTLYTYSSKSIENFARRCYSDNTSASHCQDPALNMDFDDLPPPVTSMKLPCACEMVELCLADHALVLALNNTKLYVCRHIQHLFKTNSGKNKSENTTEITFDKHFVELQRAVFNPRTSRLSWGSNAVLLLASNKPDHSLIQCFDFDGEELASLKLFNKQGGVGSFVTSVCSFIEPTLHSRFCIGFSNSSVNVIDYIPDMENETEQGKLQLYGSTDVSGGRGRAIGLCFLSASCVVGMEVDLNKTISLRLIDVDVEKKLCTWREDNETSEK